MTEKQYEEVKVMTAYLKGLGVLERKAEKKIKEKASNLLKTAKQRELTEGAFV